MNACVCVCDVCVLKLLPTEPSAVPFVCLDFFFSNSHCTLVFLLSSMRISCICLSLASSLHHQDQQVVLCTQMHICSSALYAYTRREVEREKLKRRRQKYTYVIASPPATDRHLNTHTLQIHFVQYTRCTLRQMHFSF